MKKIAVDNSNNIRERIKKDLSNFINMFSSTNEVNENEVSELGNDLKKSLEQIDAYAQKYQNSIGVPSNVKNQLHANSKKQRSTILSTQSKVKTKKDKEKTENKDSEREY